MDIHYLGSWGEFLGGIGGLVAAAGVIVTLFYLALQVRSYSASIQASTSDSIASGFIETNNLIASDPSLARIITLGLEEPSKLTEEEEVQFSFLFRSYITQYVRLFRLFREGVLRQEDWEGHAVELADMLRMPGGKAWREANPNPSQLAQEFLDAMDQVDVKPAFSFRLSPTSESEMGRT